MVRIICTQHVPKRKTKHTHTKKNNQRCVSAGHKNGNAAKNPLTLLDGGEAVRKSTEKQPKVYAWQRAVEAESAWLGAFKQAQLNATILNVTALMGARRK
jgi:hypothetical protein